jgi:Reverse transcriptase (RNA-dependent DNA polymerase)
MDHGQRAASHSERTTFTIFFVTKLKTISLDIGKRLQFQASKIGFHSNLITHQPTPFITLSEVSVDEVRRLLQSTSNKCSPLDFIPTSLLKSCTNIFSPLIAKLANLSFSQGHFPSFLKTAQVTPILKKPSLNPDDPASYRPISNLNTIGKLLERIALTRLRPHILSCPNFSPFQSAYRPGHSTETAALKIVNDLNLTMDAGGVSLLLTLDLTAAFDTIDHSKMLKRLATDFGFTGSTLNWLESYLINRCMYVKVGSTAGTTNICNSGVPQGSVLGPLLFSVYTSPISRVISSFNIQHHNYADDTTLYIKLQPNRASFNSNLEQCTGALTAWFLENGMQLNPSKSEAILVGTSAQIKKVNLDRTIHIADIPVELSDSVKIIGVTIDSQLNFNKHVINICRDSNYHIRALRHIRPVLDHETANRLACSIVNTRLDYCNSLLMGTSAHNIAMLQRVQNSLARVVCNSTRRTSSMLLLENLHWLPIKQRITYKTASIVHHALIDKSPSYLQELLIVHKPTRSLRSADKSLLVVPASRTKAGDRAFGTAGPSVWNGLPIGLREIHNHGAFKKHLKTTLFVSAFVT